MTPTRYLLVLLVLSLPVAAQEYARFLLPIYARQFTIQGAAARWTTDLTVFNTSPEDITLGPCAPGFPVDTCPPMVHVLPGSRIVRNPPPGWTDAGLHGRFIWMAGQRANDVSFDLAVLKDGVPVAKLPVVTEQAFTTRAMYLLNLPETGGTVRVYGLDNRPDTRVRARLGTMPAADRPRATIAEYTLTLVQSPYIDPAGFPYAPSYAELAINPAATTLLVEIEPLDGARVWAFASSPGPAGGLIITQPQ